MTKYIISCFLFLFTITTLNAQPGFGSASRQDHINNAESLMAQGSYFNASTYYQKALKIKSDIETMYKLAEAYRLSRAYQQAAKAYSNVLKKGEAFKSSYPLLNYHYGKVLMQNGQYDKARSALSNFIKEYKNTDQPQYIALAKNMVEGCTFAESKLAAIVQTKRVEAIEGVVNSNYTEMSPMPLGNDKLLFAGIDANEMISQKDQNVFSKIYSVSISDFNQSSNKSSFSNIINNKEVHVGNASLSTDGNRMYYTICERNIKNNRVDCKIYRSTKDGDLWINPEKLGDAFNAEGYTSSTPNVNSDAEGNDVVYYASNRPGGQGGLDIWVTNGEQPINLGSSINTAGMETCPFFINDTKADYLYFSSEGHPGLGGLDVFRASRSNINFTSWVSIVNAGAPINSPADDLYFVVNPSNKKQAYFVSNRAGTKSVSSETCCDDIFAAELKVDAKATFDGIVFESRTPLANVQANLYEMVNGQKQLIKSISSNEEGRFNFGDLETGKKYLVDIRQDGYNVEKHEFSTIGLEEDKTYTHNFYMVKPKPVSLALCGTTYSDKGNKGKSPLGGVKVEIYKIAPNTRQQSLVKSTTSDRSGNYCSDIPIGFQFKVIATESKHLTVSDMVDLRSYRPKGNEVLKKDLDLVLQYKEVGLSFKIDNIYYDFDSANLRNESIASLGKILSILNNNPTIIVEMGSHTDSKGSESYNQKLSQKRAQSVVDWLVKNGVASSRLTAKGYGEGTPVAANKNPDGSDNPEGRQLNRRTEFKVIGYVDGLRN